MIQQVDYDTSAGPRQIETDPIALERTLRQLHTATLALAPYLDQPVFVRATTPICQVMRSTLGRELWFAALHALHH